MLFTEDQQMIQQLARDFAESELAPIAAEIDQEERIPKEIIEKMAQRGVATNVHYKPLPLLTAYKNLGFDIKDYPNALAQFENEITLPLYSTLTEEDVRFICQTLKDCLQG